MTALDRHQRAPGRPRNRPGAPALAGVAAGLGLLLACATAHAHARSVSYSSWIITGTGAEVRLQLSLLDQNALQGSGRLAPGASPHTLSAYLPTRLRLGSASGGCRPVAGSWRTLDARAGWRQFMWRWQCPGPPQTIHSDLLVDTISSHAHFARLRLPEAGIDTERVLTAAQRSATFSLSAAPTQSRSSFGAYLTLGIRHILSGWDHLVFLFLLVLIARRLREVAGVVTGFTVGHSAALGLAALGYVTPSAGAIEALIGLSIVVVAVENAWLAQRRPNGRLPTVTVTAIAIVGLVAALMGRLSPLVVLGVCLFAASYFGLIARAARPELWRWGLASLFGLVHGFGFAGALDWLALPTERLATALVGFNLGVEVAQIALVALTWPLLVWVRRRDPSLALVHYGSAAALCAGTFWFINRLYWH